MIILVFMVFLSFKIFLFLLPNGLRWNIKVLGGFFHHGLLYWLTSPFQCHQNSPISGLSSTIILIPCDTPPSSLMDSTVSPKVKTTKEKGVGVCFMVHSTSGVEGRAGAPGWD